jgi:hypothetical protein
MAAPKLASSNGEAPVGDPAVVESALSTDERKQLLSDALAMKTQHGYRIESQSDTEAILLMRSRRRWFGLVGGGSETRQLISVDEQGRTRTRPA